MGAVLLAGLRRTAALLAAFAAIAVASAAMAHGQAMPTQANTMSPDLPAESPAAAQIRDELRRAGNYLVGKDGPRDPVQAAYWFKKAADQGDPGAQNELGYLYIWGLGVPRDEEQAFRWFARAAGSGWEQAKLNMAVMYLRGMGVARDPRFGRDLLAQLAEKKNARAEDYLGVMYLDGYGVQQDSRAAEEWFSRSAKGKNPEGEYAMGQLYSVGEGHAHDLEKAAKFLRESARAGYVPAMYTLGVLLVSRPEIERKGSGEAIGWLERAAEAGTWQSSAMLGTLALDGRGQGKDVGEAFRWFTIAARQGGAEAEVHTRANLAQCRGALGSGEQDEELHAAQTWLDQHPHADLFVFDDMRAAFPVGEVYAMRASGP